jgi:hypothetical protein
MLPSGCDMLYYVQYVFTVPHLLSAHYTRGDFSDIRSKHCTGVRIFVFLNVQKLWLRHVARIEDMRNAQVYSILAGEPEGAKLPERRGRNVQGI